MARSRTARTPTSVLLATRPAASVANRWTPSVDTKPGPLRRVRWSSTGRYGATRMRRHRPPPAPPWHRQPWRTNAREPTGGDGHLRREAPVPPRRTAQPALAGAPVIEATSHVGAHRTTGRVRRVQPRPRGQGRVATPAAALAADRRASHVARTISSARSPAWSATTSDTSTRWSAARSPSQSRLACSACSLVNRRPGRRSPPASVALADDALRHDAFGRTRGMCRAWGRASCGRCTRPSAVRRSSTEGTATPTRRCHRCRGR